MLPQILGPLRWVLVQSESVELDFTQQVSELTIYTLLPLHHVARAWPNFRCEDINEILYRPSIVPGGGAEQIWRGAGLQPPPHQSVKPPLPLSDAAYVACLHRRFQIGHCQGKILVNCAYCYIILRNDGAEPSDSKDNRPV